MSDLQQPISPSWYSVGTGVLGQPVTSATVTVKNPIPNWLVPIVGIGVVAALSTNALFFKPIVIILIGIIALWFMEPYLATPSANAGPQTAVGKNYLVP